MCLRFEVNKSKTVISSRKAQNAKSLSKIYEPQCLHYSIPWSAPFDLISFCQIQLRQNSFSRNFPLLPLLSSPHPIHNWLFWHPRAMKWMSSPSSSTPSQTLTQEALHLLKKDKRHPIYKPPKKLKHPVKQIFKQN